MSHFVVLVIGENWEEQLAPYQENNMGDCPREYMVFHNAEPEYREQWENEEIDMVIAPDGRILHTWDKEFTKLDSTSARAMRDNVLSTGHSTYMQVIPEGFKIEKVPFNKVYPTFDQFMRDWARCGYSPEQGAYGYWMNPNAKWDWYELGGRWTGFFTLKEGRVGSLGSPGLMTPPAEVGTADQAKNGDIDWEAMREEAGVEGGKHWDKFWNVARNLAPVSWRGMLKKHEGNIDVARKEYHNHPSVRALNSANIYPGEDAWEKYGNDRQAYVEKCKKRAFATFAVVKDGIWHEQGEMLMFGIVENEKNEDMWIIEWDELVGTTPDDTLFTIVDCHI